MSTLPKTSGRLNRAVEHLLTNLSTNLSQDTQELVESFKLAFNEISDNYQGRKPNVLVAGVTGAGKSTLINKVFGQNLADTGTGAPVTQHFTRYSSPSQNVIIYDSKGLEVGEYHNFITDTNEFLENHPNEIDVCWYIVNSAGSRFQSFEGEVCQKVFNSIPVIFVLNKADISTNKDRQILKQVINDLNLDNQVAILETVSTRVLNLSNIPDICPNCGSDDLDIRKKRKIVECEDCRRQYPFVTKIGLDNLISKTINILPDVAKDHFVAAQQVSIHEKNRAARECIQQFKHFIKNSANNNNNNNNNKSMRLKQIIQLLVKLSNIWGFHITLLDSDDENEMYETILSAFESIDETDYDLNDDLALSIIWNQAVSSLYREIFRESYGTFIQTITQEEIEEELPELTLKAFSILTPERIETYRVSIKRHNLENILDIELPEEIENDKSCSMDDIPLPIRSSSSHPLSSSPTKNKSTNKTNQPPQS